MRSNFTAVVLALVLFGGLGYYFLYMKAPGTTTPASETAGETVPTTGEVAPSTATNYDECIAEGGKTLPDALDKCLTADGHLFIQGVTE